MRGEYIPVLAPPPPAKGSPPLARGIPPRIITGLRSDGITPACAGNTFAGAADFHRGGDHPRLRGEYHPPHLQTQDRPGSPPLARGIHERKKRTDHDDGITPACAGNTCPPSGMSQATRDHPRLRGEYHFNFILLLLCLGSPPLARGIH